MKPKQNGMDSEWETIAVAGKRLGRSPGHLSRLCLNRLHKEGKARFVHGGGKKGHWVIDPAATLDSRRSGAALKPVKPIMTAGQLLQITIGSCTVTTTGNVTITQTGVAPVVTAPGTVQKRSD